MNVETFILQEKAFELALSELKISGSVTVTNEPEIIFSADRLVLPGVGAFAECYNKLKSINGLRESITERVHDHFTPIGNMYRYAANGK